MIVSIELIMAKIIQGSGLNVNYHFGDQKELLKYLRVKRNNDSVDIAYGKYSTLHEKPFVWLVVGGGFPTKSNISYDDRELSFNNIRLIISCYTKEEWLNTTRWRNTMLNLNKTEDDLKGILRESKYLSMSPDRWSVYSEPNISYSELTGSNTGKNTAFEAWDAVVIDTQMNLYTSCLNELNIEDC